MVIVKYLPQSFTVKVTRQDPIHMLYDVLYRRVNTGLSDKGAQILIIICGTTSSCSI